MYDDEHIKQKLFRSVYIPEYKEKDTDIVRQFSEGYAQEAVQAELKKNDEAIEEGIRKAEREKRPLTNQEMKIVARRYAKLKEDSVRVKNKVNIVRKEIDFNLTEKPYTFTFEGSKKSALRKAMKIVFGASSNEITYEQYKEALEIKKDMEKRDIADVFSGEEHGNN